MATAQQKASPGVYVTDDIGLEVVHADVEPRSDRRSRASWSRPPIIGGAGSPVV